MTVKIKCHDFLRTEESENSAGVYIIWYLHIKKAHNAFSKKKKRQVKLQLRFDLGNTYKLKILQ